MPDSTSPAIARRALLRLAALGAGAAAATVALSACGQGATPVASTASTAAATASKAPATASTAASASSSPATSAAATATAATTSPVASAASAASTTTRPPTVSTSATSSTAVPASAAAPATGAITLDFWTSLNDPISQGLLDPWAKKFTQQNPGIAVHMNYVDGSSNYEKYTTAMVGGTPPDGILTSGFPIAVQWAAAGQIQPMDQWANQLGVKQADYWPWVWSMQNFHGKLWCLVQEYDTNVFVWNKALFRTAGLAADGQPTTLSDLDAAAAKLEKKGADGSIEQAGFIPWLGTNVSLWLAAHGTDIFDAKNGKWTFDTPQARDTLTWYQQYLNRLGGINAVNTFTKPFTGKVTAVGSGKLGMQTVGDWVPLMDYNQDSPSLEYGVGVIPAASGVAPGTNTVIGSDTFVLPTGVKHAQESMRFMLYMDSADPVLAWCLGEANVPPTPAMANDPRFIKGFPYGAVLVQMAKSELLHPFPVSPSYSQITGFLNTAVNSVLKGATTPEAALTQAQQQADQAQQQFSAKNPGW